MWNREASSEMSRTTRPSSSKAITRAVRRGAGRSRSGSRVASLRTAIGARITRSTTGSVGEAIVTQTRPSVPRAMLSG